MDTPRDDRTPDTSEDQDLQIIELEERLEFGTVIIDSDLGADDNTGCSNYSNCGYPANQRCSNTFC